MKTKLGLILMLFIALIITLQANQTITNEDEMQLATVVPIQLGTNNCVCKGSTCQDANWVSFRKFCGYSQSGTDFECGNRFGDNCQ